MTTPKPSRSMGLAEILLATGLFALALAAMVGVLAQGSPVPRYVAEGGLLCIAAGGVAALLQKWRRSRGHGDR